MNLHRSLHLVLAGIAVFAAMMVPGVAFAEDITGKAVISGDTAGQALVCQVSGSNATSFEYNWVYNGTQKGWSTSNTFTPPDTAAGKQVWCHVRAEGFDGQLTANAVTLQAPPEVTKYTLTVNISGNGTVRYGGQTLSNGQTLQIAAGTACEFALSSGTGTVCSNVTFSGGSGSWTTGSVSFTMPSGNMTVSITFSEKLSGTATISGSNVVGSTVTCVTSGFNAGGLSYKWISNGTYVSGATSSTYTLRESDAGKMVMCEVTSSEKPGAVTATIEVVADTTSKYTVSYNYAVDAVYGKPSGVTMPSSVTGVKSGTTITLAAVPSSSATSANGKTGAWVCTGWYTNSACTGTPVTSLTVTQDITLYCKWQFVPDAKKLTIYYGMVSDATYGKPSDVSAPSSTSAVESTTVTLKPLPTTSETTANGVSGSWTCTGWYTSSSCSGSQVSSLTVTKEMTVFCKWKFTPADTPPATTYTVTFDVKPDPTYGMPAGFSVPAAISGISYGDNIAVPAVSTSSTSANGVSGTWEWKGWYQTAFLAGTQLVTTYQVVSDRTLYGKWTFTPDSSGQYTITYVFVKDPTYGLPAGVSVPDPSVVNAGDPLTLAALPSSPTDKAGVAKGTWSVTGWYKDSTCTGSPVTSYTPTADRKVYAQWTFTPETHTVKYVIVDDPTYGHPSGAAVIAPTKHKCGDDAKLVAGLTTSSTTANGKTGVWSFRGWYSNKECTGKPVMTLTELTDDTTVYGKWIFTDSAISCTVSFDANGGTGTMESATVPEADTFVLPTCEFTAPEGMQFKAWKVGSKEKAEGAEITVKADTVVTAIWEKVPEVAPDPDAEGDDDDDEGENGTGSGTSGVVKASYIPWWIIALNVLGIGFAVLSVILIARYKKSRKEDEEA